MSTLSTMPDPMPSTDIDCPLCGAPAGRPCVQAREQDDGPMNHTERHAAWAWLQEEQKLHPIDEG